MKGSAGGDADLDEVSGDAGLHTEEAFPTDTKHIRHNSEDQCDNDNTDYKYKSSTLNVTAQGHARSKTDLGQASGMSLGSGRLIESVHKNNK